MDPAALPPCRLLPSPLPLLPQPARLQHRALAATTLPGDRGRPVVRGGPGRLRLRVNGLFGDGGDDGLRAVMRIVRLSSAVRNRSVRELLELAGDECQYLFSKLLPSFSVSQMTKNMLMILHEMMLRHHVSIVLKPTEDQGFDLGIKWSLEWKGKKLPWDMGCNVSTTHVYKGMFIISQVNKAFLPLLHRILQTIQQNLDAVISAVTDKILPEGTLDEKQTSTVITCAITGLATMLLFFLLFNSL